MAQKGCAPWGVWDEEFLFSYINLILTPKDNVNYYSIVCLKTKII